MKAYAAEFGKKLRSNGAAFIHHSNRGEYGTVTNIEGATILFCCAQDTENLRRRK